MNTTATCALPNPPFVLPLTRQTARQRHSHPAFHRVAAGREVAVCRGQPLVLSVALPAPETALAERVLTGAIVLAVGAALVEAVGLMLRITPAWETFSGWAPRILF